ncbi:MAG: carboxypeptidase-like regulatory domain-containing protein [Flavobacteriaceae bacterium]
MKNLLYISFLFLGVLYSCSTQKITETDNNPKIVKGSVLYYEYNEPLAGALIQVKGSKKENFTMTDFDGNFEIEVKKGKILIISYVGFGIEEVIVTDQNNYDIVLRIAQPVKTKKDERRLKRELRRKGQIIYPD